MAGITALAERLSKRRWAPEVADAMVGATLRCAVTHAADASVRQGAASGGSVSALLLDALARGEADAALVARTVVEDGRVRARYRLATTADEVLAARGSTYVLGDFMGEALPLIAAHPGRVAVVCLPCEATALARREDLASKAVLVIALFCGHASRTDLVDAVTSRLVDEAGSHLTAFRFRAGHWRGMMTATFASGAVLERPFSFFGRYQNLYYGCAKKCLFCGDHFGFDADMGAGDLWSARYENDPVKHTALVAKTRRGLEALSAAQTAGSLVVEDVPVDVVLDGQRRIAPFHANVSARAKAGARLGIRIPDRGQRVRWHEYLAARIVLANHLATDSTEGLVRTLARPRWHHTLLLYVLKGLESLS